jgi:hypothetical protein
MSQSEWTKNQQKRDRDFSKRRKIRANAKKYICGSCFKVKQDFSRIINDDDGSKSNLCIECDHKINK